MLTRLLGFTLQPPLMQQMRVLFLLFVQGGTSRVKPSGRPEVVASILLYASTEAVYNVSSSRGQEIPHAKGASLQRPPQSFTGGSTAGPKSLGPSIYSSLGRDFSCLEKR